jgi:hypothetical protein
MPEVGLSYLRPTGIFSDYHNVNGVGLEGGIHFQFDPSHAYTVGILGSYHYFDSNKIEFVEQIDGINIDLEESVTSQLFTFLGTFRYYPPLLKSDIKIYTDLYFGPKIFFTTYSLRDSDGGDYVSEFDIEKSDVSLSYGVGLGIQIPLWRYMHLNLKGSYIPGVSASYYNKISPEVEDPEFALDGYELKNSSTNAGYLSLGISFFL